MDEYAARESRVSAIHLEQNGGQGIARNVGFEQAGGEYVYFLDSDDMIAPEALQALYERAVADDLDGVFFDSQAIFESDELAERNASYLGMRQGDYPQGVTTGAELLDLFCQQREWTCYVQRQLWRRSFLAERGIRFPVWSSHEDEAFAFEAILSAERVAYKREPYFIRRYREGSVMTTKPSLKKLKSYFMCCCEMEEFFAKQGGSLWAEREIFRIYEACVRIYDQLVAEGEDVDAGFAGTELESRYLLFKTAMRSYIRYAMFSDALEAKLKAASQLYIYGAGVIARRVHKALAMMGLAVEAFVVTDATKNPVAFEGHRVMGVDALPEPPEGSLVLISLTDGYRAEVEAALDEKGWAHAFYKD
jgi:glycosyltransferase involved in cell wall biosynthesis